MNNSDCIEDLKHIARAPLMYACTRESLVAYVTLLFRFSGGTDDQVNDIYRKFLSDQSDGSYDPGYLGSRYPTEWGVEVATTALEMLQPSK